MRTYEEQLCNNPSCKLLSARNKNAVVNRYQCTRCSAIHDHPSWKETIKILILNYYEGILKIDTAKLPENFWEKECQDRSSFRSFSGCFMLGRKPVSSDQKEIDAIIVDKIKCELTVLYADNSWEVIKDSEQVLQVRVKQIIRACR